MDLEQKLNQTNTAARINAIDAAYRGNPYRGSNFKVSWQGYNNDGLAVVKYQNRTYSARNIAGRSTIANTKVTLRVAKGFRQVNY